MIKPKESRSILGGTQDLYEFANGYGASVIRHRWSYGNELGLFELAVIEWDDKYVAGWDLIYDVPDADNLVGHLTADEVQERLTQIEKFQGVRGKCEFCGSHGRRVRDHPYVALYDRKHMAYLCKTCLQARYDDI